MSDELADQLKKSREVARAPRELVAHGVAENGSGCTATAFVEWRRNLRRDKPRKRGIWARFRQFLFGHDASMMLNLEITVINFELFNSLILSCVLIDQMVPFDRDAL